MLTGNKWSSWIGYGLSGLVILFMLFDGGIKLVPLDIVITATAELGYPASVGLARGLGILGLVDEGGAHRGPGTIWAFLPTDGGSVLMPDASSGVRRIRLRFTDLATSGLDGPASAIHEFFTLRTRRFAAVEHGGRP